jgi:hypothetical protein
MSDQVRAALTAQLTVCRAQSAARAGDLDRAAQLLDGLDAASVTTATLDLRARLHAQRNELTEADRCWAEVQALAPDDPDAAAGRRAVQEIITGRRRARPLVQARRVAVALAALGVVSAGGLAWTAIGTDDRPADAVDLAEQMRAEADRADTLEERVTTMEAQRAAQDAERAAAQTRLANSIAAVAEGLRLPGVLLEARATDVRVVFQQGLFSRGTEITQDGVTLLTELGRRLATMDVHTTVVGHAVAVPGGRTNGGSMVALGRAQLSAGYLAAGGSLPLTEITLASADQTQGPFPDPARNRTVTLVITPVQPPLSTR